MGDEANAMPAGGPAQQATLAALLFEISATDVIQVEEDEVRLDSRQVALDARQLSQSLGERPRVGMVLCQPIDHGFERDQPGRRDYARLPHSATESLAPPPRLVDRVRAAAEHAPGRAAETFGEAEGNRVTARSDGGDVRSACDCGVEHPGAVEVHAQAQSTGSLIGGAQVFQRPDDAA